MAKAPERKKTTARNYSNVPGKKSTSTGSQFLDFQVPTAEKWKPPTNYKPLTRREKLAIGASFLPIGAVASAAGKVATAASKGKYLGKTVQTTKKFTQTPAVKTSVTKNAAGKSTGIKSSASTKITVTPPKKTGVGISSPVKGTKVEVKRTSRQSPTQQASQKQGAAARKRATSAATAVRGYSAKTIEDKQGKKKK